MPNKLLFLILILFLAACGSQSAQPALTNPSSAPTRTVTVVVSTAKPEPTFTRRQPRVNLTTSGIIRFNETWRGEIHLTGDITFANGATLTIEPGTQVYVTPNQDDQGTGVECIDQYIRDYNDPVGSAEWDQNAILIDGRNGVIQAIGTAEQPIVFRPEGEGTSPAQWYGIFIETGSLQHSQILYGGRTAVQVVPTGQGVEIAYNEVRFAHWSNISDFGQNSWVHHNIVEGGGHQALNSGFNAVVEYNIVRHSQTCLAVDEKATVRNNLFIDCARGVRLGFGDDIRFINNTIAWVNGPPDGWYYQGKLIYPAFKVTEGIGLMRTLLGTQILNNIIYGPYQSAISLLQQPGEGSVIDYNLMWGQTELFGGQWQSAPIGEQNINQAPLFVDPAGGDFHLQPGSPAIDAGYPQALDPDGSPADLGAYGGPAAAW